MESWSMMWPYHLLVIVLTPMEFTYRTPEMYWYTKALWLAVIFQLRINYCTFLCIEITVGIRPCLVNVVLNFFNSYAGDDCISIQTGCSNVYVHNVECGPGHGISIGGLGKDNTRACVSNITVRDVNMHNTMNGVRIKTWQVKKIHKLKVIR